MPITSMKFRGHRCFATEWSGFEQLKPVNVIIGRNNVGKSQLLDLVRDACGGWSPNKPAYELLLRGSAEESQLTGQFLGNTNGGDLQGNHWRDNGARFVGVPFKWIKKPGQVDCPRDYGTSSL